MVPREVGNILLASCLQVCAIVLLCGSRSRQVARILTRQVAVAGGLRNRVVWNTKRDAKIMTENDSIRRIRLIDISGGDVAAATVELW